MKIIYLISVLFLASFQLTYTQSKQNIDSLLNVYNKSNIDSIKLKTSNRIVAYYLYRDVNKAKYYALKQLQLGDKLNDITGKKKANHQLSIIYNSIDKYDSAKYYIEKTIKLSEITKDLSQQSLSRHSLVILEISKGTTLPSLFLIC